MCLADAVRANHADRAYLVLGTFLPPSVEHASTRNYTLRVPLAFHRIVADVGPEIGLQDMDVTRAGIEPATL